MTRENIDNIIQKEIQDGNIAGASICVLKNGEELFRGQYGLSDMEKHIAMQRDTIFRLYSMTKPITAVAIMILVERGKLDLREPVSKYLTGFENQKVVYDGKLVEANTQVTIQQLLNMTSGIVYPDSDVAGKAMEEVFETAIQKTETDESLSTIDFCNQIGMSPLAFQPGTQWRYGASADILGAIVEVVSGKKFSQFLQEEIFEPLGMRDTGFYVPSEKINRFSQNYEYNDDLKKIMPYNRKHLVILNYLQPPTFESGGAGLVSTIDDYAAFATMLLNGGKYNGKRILGRKTVDYITVNQLNTNQLPYMNWEELSGYGYGNLMRVLIDKAEANTNGSQGEYGWSGWTGNYFTIDPEENLIILYFIQRVDYQQIHEIIRRLRAVVYSMLE